MLPMRPYTGTTTAHDIAETETDTYAAAGGVQGQSAGAQAHPGPRVLEEQDAPRGVPGRQHGPRDQVLPGRLRDGGKPTLPVTVSVGSWLLFFPRKTVK